MSTVVDFRRSAGPSQTHCVATEPPQPAEFETENPPTPCGIGGFMAHPRGVAGYPPTRVEPVFSRGLILSKRP